MDKQIYDSFIFGLQRLFNFCILHRLQSEQFEIYLYIKLKKNQLNQPKICDDYEIMAILICFGEQMVIIWYDMIRYDYAISSERILYCEKK